MTMFISAGYLDGLELANDRNPDLSREPHLLRDLAGDLARQRDGAEIVDAVLLHVDPDLPTALHGERLGHPAKAPRDPFEVVDAGEVVLVGLAARPGPATRQCVAGGHQIGIGAPERL